MRNFYALSILLTPWTVFAATPDALFKSFLPVPAAIESKNVAPGDCKPYLGTWKGVCEINVEDQHYASPHEFTISVAVPGPSNECDYLLVGETFTIPGATETNSQTQPWGGHVSKIYTWGWAADGKDLNYQSVQFIKFPSVHQVELNTETGNFHFADQNLVYQGEIWRRGVAPASVSKKWLAGKCSYTKQ